MKHLWKYAAATVGFCVLCGLATLSAQMPAPKTAPKAQDVQTQPAPVAKETPAAKPVTPPAPFGFAQNQFQGVGNQVIVNSTGNGKTYYSANSVGKGNKVMVSHIGGEVINMNALKYEGKDTKFWSKKEHNKQLDCDLFWCPKHQMWFEWNQKDDAYRPSMRAMNLQMQAMMQKMQTGLPQMPAFPPQGQFNMQQPFAVPQMPLQQPVNAPKMPLADTPVKPATDQAAPNAKNAAPVQTQQPQASANTVPAPLATQPQPAFPQANVPQFGGNLQAQMNAMNAQMAAQMKAMQMQMQQTLPQVVMPQNGPQVGFPQPAFPQTGFPQTGFPQATFPQTGFPQTGLPQPAQPQPTQPQPTQPQPVQPQPSQSPATTNPISQ